MKFSFEYNSKTFSVNVDKPIDLSLAVTDFTRAWFIDPPKFEPVRLGENWVGSVAEGGSVNFRNVTLNPHAHCTHTESLGHVTKEILSINSLIKTHWFVAELITVPVMPAGGDQVLTATAIDKAWKNQDVEALIIRTSPNNPQKATENLSNSNWPFMDAAATEFIRERGVKHLLIDQPSVDKEEDGGHMFAHKAFWNVPEKPRKNATITELIFVPDSVKDGLYLLNLQVAPIENDAAPSRPVIFGLEG